MTAHYPDGRSQLEVTARRMRGNFACGGFGLDEPRLSEGAADELELWNIHYGSRLSWNARSGSTGATRLEWMFEAPE